MRLVILAGLSILLCISAAHAAKKSPQKRQGAQQVRIAQAHKSGKLSATEHARLQRQQARIAKARRKVASDGNITLVEKRKVQKMQNRVSRKNHRKASR